MKQVQSPLLDKATLGRSTAPLDLVVPFTVPRLTEIALRAAHRLGAGLDAAVRLVKVQVVPFPLDLRFSPVPVDFLEEQLRSLFGEGDSVEIRLAREFEEGLRGALRYRSMVVLATNKRPWRTRTERLAESLRKAGYTVVMVPENGAGDALAAPVTAHKEYQHA